jgi:N-methylhydantoinase A
LPAIAVERGDGDPRAAKVRDHLLWIDGGLREGAIYDRKLLRAGDVMRGPAIVVEMDATTLVEPGHIATVDGFGNLLIVPA